MPAVKQLVEYHIARLKDKNADVRLKSINELALLGDSTALDALRILYEEDPEEEVRKAAQEAGRAIFKRQQNENANSQS